MYETAAAFRQAIETRLNERARTNHVEVNRLRRGLVFERITARLGAAEPGAWVVKGGMVLEWRLGELISGPELRERLVDLFAADKQDDRLLFEVGPPQALDVGFRFSVTASMAGKAFASVRLHVAARAEELLSTEKLQVPGALPAFDRLAPPQVEVASPAQHFAEKLHGPATMASGSTRASAISSI